MNRPMSKLSIIMPVLDGRERIACALETAGGFPPIPLMEDVALCRQLKRVGRPLCISEQVTTSGRRWEQQGVLRTILLMWRLRLAYFLGADPQRLARRYGYDS